MPVYYTAAAAARDRNDQSIAHTAAVPERDRVDELVCTAKLVA